MPPLRTQVIPEQLYAAGTRIGTFNVPTGVTRAIWSATRVSWPDTGAEILTFNCDLSLDNGRNWVPSIGFGTTGGDVYIGKDGTTLATESTCAITIPDPTNNQRRLRATVTNTI